MGKRAEAVRTAAAAGRTKEELQRLQLQEKNRRESRGLFTESSTRNNSSSNSKRENTDKEPPLAAAVDAESANSGGKAAKDAAATAATAGANLAEKDAAKPSKKGKYRREKPWDSDDIDHWKIEPFTPKDNPYGLLEESSFACLFPQYREQYLKEVWPEVKKALAPHGIKAELDLVEGSLTVRTTRKTYDPYIIIKARDMIKLLARSVPIAQACKILEDGMFCDIMKIGGITRSKEKFVKRRQRLVGPNGSTLKAIELLTKCYVLVQGQTVAIMGSPKGIKQVHRIVEDCMKNMHPVYHIKEMMIKRELEKDPALAKENWDRFLPHFKKRNVQRKKKVIVKKKKSTQWFPPEQTPRKEDLLMESGEYFVTQELQKMKRAENLLRKQKAKTEERKRQREQALQPTAHNLVTKRLKKTTESALPSQSLDTANLLKKFKDRQPSAGKDKAEGS